MQIGPYTVSGEIARGGMGVVYRASEPATERDVAIKVLLRGGAADPVLQRRFEREAEALGRLNHPHIVRVHSIGNQDGTPYIVMDYVPGLALSQHLERDGPLPAREAAEILGKLAHAVQHAHEHSIVHRDVKPDNVLLLDGEPHLTDFGLARDLDAPSRLTKTGLFLGTPGYLAPEQARGESAGPCADVFGLGATLYALLTGEPPFSGDSLVEVMAALMSVDPVPPSQLRDGLDMALDAICLKCLEKKGPDRYPTANALAEDLERFLKGDAVLASANPRARLQRWLAKRSAPIAASLAGVLLVVGVLFAGFIATMPAETLRSQQTPSARAEALKRAESKVLIAQAREQHAQRAFQDALQTLAKVPEPPPQLVWELNRALAYRTLNSDDAANDIAAALAAIRAPVSRQGLNAGGDEIRQARSALAREVARSASGRIASTLVAPGRPTLYLMTELLRLARELLPDGDHIEIADLEPIPQLVSTQLGLVVAKKTIHANFELALAAADLAPRDPALLTDLVTMSIGPISKADLRRLVPYARILAKRKTGLKERILVAGLLLEVGELDEALQATEAVLESDLDVGSRVGLLLRRAGRYSDEEKHELSLKDSDAAIALSPSNPDLRLARFDTLTDLGRNDAALDELCTLFSTINWGPPDERVLHTRPFRSAAERLWEHGGRTQRPQVMRDVLRRAVKGIDTDHPARWWLRLAVVEVEQNAHARGRVALAAATELIVKRKKKDYLKDELAACSLAIDAGGPDAVIALDRLLSHYEAGPPAKASSPVRSDR